MHILIIPSWYPATADDLKGCFFREQAFALARFGLQVGVLSFHGHAWINFPRLGLWPGILEAGRNLDVNTWRVHHISGIPGYGRIFLFRVAARFFTKYCCLYGKPDILHAHSALDGGWLAMKLSRAYNIPYVITEHASDFLAGSLPEKKRVKSKKVFTGAAKIITVSSSLASCLIKYCDLSEDIRVVPNILNENYFNQIKSKTRQPGEQFTFLNIGTLIQRKGHDILIRAFANEFRNNSEVKLLIGGEGCQYEFLEQLIIDLEMTTRIQLLGRLPRSLVFQHMSQCDAFVVSSRYETFGVVLIEALACGMPVVATNCGGPSDIVTPMNGIIVKRNSITALGRGMRSLYDSFDKYDAAQIRADCISRFGENAVTGTLDQIYRSIMEGRGTSQ